jgi:RHS repeat-associated protein
MYNKFIVNQNQVNREAKSMKKIILKFGKKLFFIAMIICILTNVIPINGGTLVRAASERFGDYDFDRSDGTITKYYGDGGNVIIPERIDDAAVVTIGRNAFYKAALTSVTLPESIAKIDFNAFDSCKELTEVISHNGNASWAGNAFRNCDNLTKIIFADGVTNVNESLNLMSIANLTEVALPKTLKNIGADAFRNCRKLSKAVLPDGLEAIGNAAFRYCEALTEIFLPNSVAAIGEEAFAGSGLKSIMIPEDIITINNGVFSRCANLTEVVLNDKLTHIKSFAFSYTALMSVELPKSVVKIDDTAFTSCKDLTEVISHNGEAAWTTGAFFGCNDLTRVIFAEGVANISKSINLSDTHIDGIVEIVLPNTLKNIGDRMFSGCNKITEIVVPDGVETIGENAFYTCDSLRIVTIPGSVTSIGKNIFNEQGKRNVVIRAMPDTYAETYALENGLRLESMLSENMASLRVTLPEPTKSGQYAGTKINAVNKSTGLAIATAAVYSRGGLTYTIGWLDKSETYKVEHITAFGRVLSELDDVTLTGEITDIVLIALPPDEESGVEPTEEPTDAVPQIPIPAGPAVTVRVMDEAASDITNKVLVTWYDANGNFLKRGNILTGVSPGTEVFYQVDPGIILGTKYYAVPRKSYTNVSEGDVIIETLSLIPQIVITGKIVDGENGKPVEHASVCLSQTVNGKYENKSIVYTDAGGNFTAFMREERVTVRIFAAGYSEKALSLKEFIGGAAFGEIPVDKAKPASVVPEMNMRYATEEGAGTSEPFTEINDVGFTVKDQRSGEFITDFHVLYPDNILNVPAEYNQYSITAQSRNGIFSEKTAYVTIDGNLKGRARFDFTQRGMFSVTYASSENTENVLLIYDDGKSSLPLIKTYEYTGGTVITDPLPDGGYRLVSMGKDLQYNSIQTFHELQKTALKSGTDYVYTGAAVREGYITNIDAGNIPAFDSQKFIYTDSASYINISKSTVAVGQYITVQAKIILLPEYQSGADNNIELFIPITENCSYLAYSAVAGSDFANVREMPDGLYVSVSNPGEAIRLCFAADDAGTYALGGMVKFSYDGENYSQPLGAVYFTAENLSFNVPQVTSQTEITAGGIAAPSAEIIVFCDNAAVGQTKAFANGNWSVQIELPYGGAYSNHSLYAAVYNPDGTTAVTESKNVLYDETYADVSRVTMRNRSQRQGRGLSEEVTVFNFLEPSSRSPIYYFFPGLYDTFTFDIEFTRNDPDIIGDVWLNVLCESGKTITLEAQYDSQKGFWTARSDFQDAPVSVGVDYENLLIRAAVINSFEGATGAGRDVSDRSYLKPVREIPAEGESYEVRGISPDKGSKGKVTVKITGSLLDSNFTAALRKGGVTITAEKTYYISPSLIYATFDLTNADDGVYDLTVACGGRSDTLPGCFTLDGTLPKGKLETQINIAGDLKRGDVYSGSVTYTNTGYTDVSAPVLILRGNNMQLAATGEEWGFGKNIRFFAANDSGLAGVFANGETGGFNFQYRSFSVNTFGIEIVDLGLLGSQVMPKYAINAISPQSWITANSQNIIRGETAGEYAENTAQTASYLNQFDWYSVPDLSLINAAFQNIGNGFMLGDVIYGSEDIASLATVFNRFYPSGIIERGKNGSLGYGWRHGFEANAVWYDSIQESYLRIDVMGSSLLMKLADGIYIDAEQGLATAVMTNQKAVVTLSGGDVLFFGPDGTLENITYISGMKATLEYGGGLLTGIASSNGDRLILQYDDGLIASVASQLTGEKIEYAYVNGFLTSATTKQGTVNYAYNTDMTSPSRYALTKVTYADGTEINYEYDSLGRYCGESGKDGLGKVSYRYGDYGEVAVIDCGGNETLMYFDAFGNILRTQKPNGETTNISCDGQQVQNVVFGADIKYITEFDEFNNLSKVTNPMGGVTSYSYDKFGNFTKITDQRGITTLYGRDGAGMMQILTFPDGSTEKYTYDDNYNITAFQNRKGETATFSYDKYDRVIRSEYAGGTVIIYEYDTPGNLARVTENDQTTSFDYDEAGNITGVAYPGGMNVGYGYDAVGRMTSVTDNEGITTRYEYNGIGQLIKLTGNDGNIITEYEYYPCGRLLKQTNANGTYTEYLYDIIHLASIVNGGPGGIISRFDYTYDSLGRIETMTDSDGLWKYEYDKLDQLIKSTSPDGTITNYTYDAAGNRLAVSVNGASSDYNVNDLNQYTKVGGGVLVYDKNGSLISRTDENGVTEYEYDYLNRLVKVTSPDGVFEYGYDIYGNRNKIIENGELTEYLISPLGLGNVLASYSGGNVTKYLQGVGLTASVTDGETYFYAYNYIGSTVNITDKNGTSVNSYKYNCDGQITAKTESINNPFTYVGQHGIIDDKTGLYYMRARYVSKETGSFITPDPSRQQNDLNMYRYAANNPVTNFDLNGRITVSGGVGCSGSFGGVRVSGGLRLVCGGGKCQLQFTAGTGFQTSPGGSCGGTAGVSDAPDPDSLAGPGSSVGCSGGVSGFSGGFDLSKSGKYREGSVSLGGGTPGGECHGEKTNTTPITDFSWPNEFLDNAGEAYNFLWPPESDYPGAPAQGIIDPSGVVYEAVLSNRITDATVVCLMKKQTEDIYGESREIVDIWDAEEYQQENPLLTDETGYYRWDVPTGMWRVMAEKEGYETAYSDWLPVPPPQLDVNIALASYVKPEVAQISAYADSVEVAFSKYMRPATLTDSIIITLNGQKISGAVKFLNEEANPKNADETFASIIEFVFDSPVAFGSEIEISVKSTAESYAGVILGENYITSVIVKDSGVEPPPEPDESEDYRLLIVVGIIVIVLAAAGTVVLVVFIKKYRVKLINGK